MRSAATSLLRPRVKRNCIRRRTRCSSSIRNDGVLHHIRRKPYAPSAICRPCRDDSCGVFLTAQQRSGPVEWSSAEVTRVVRSTFTAHGCPCRQRKPIADSLAVETLGHFSARLLREYAAHDRRHALCDDSYNNLAAVDAETGKERWRFDGHAERLGPLLSSSGWKLRGTPWRDGGHSASSEQPRAAAVAGCADRDPVERLEKEARYRSLDGLPRISNITHTTQSSPPVVYRDLVIVSQYPIASSKPIRSATCRL